MTGRSPARLLAPLALVVTAVALFAVVTSSGSDGAEESEDGARPAATATATGTPEERGEERRRTRTYTVKPGDVPETIAERLDVEVDDLLAANPDVSPSALSPGQKLKIP